MISYSLLPEDWWKQGQNFMESSRNTVNRLTNTSPNTLSQLKHEDSLDLQKQWQADPGQTVMDNPDFSAKDMAAAFNETNPNSLGLANIPRNETSTATLNTLPGLKGTQSNQVTPSDAGEGGTPWGGISSLLKIAADLVNQEEPVQPTAPPTAGQKPDQIANLIIDQGNQYEDLQRRFALAAR